MSELPEPLVPADVDLKGFPGFVLDVEMLLASELIALATPEEIAAALMLWCRAWQQTPHGSLPNDERILAAFSKSKNWKRVREMALRGFVLCADGRLYHRTLCKKVLDAWKSRKEHEKKREKDAERLRVWREKKQTGNGDETRFDGSSKPVGSEGEEKGSEVTTSSVPIGTGGEPPGEQGETTKTPEQMTRDELWSASVSLLTDGGMPEKQCRSFVGGLVKRYSNEIVIESVRAAIVERPADPVSFLKAACMARKGEGGKSLIPWHATDAGVIAKGKELSLSPNRGEKMVDFKARVIVALEKKDNPPAAAAATPTPAPSPTPTPSASAAQIPVEPRQFKPDGVGPLKDLMKGKAA